PSPMACSKPAWSPSSSSAAPPTSTSQPVTASISMRTAVAPCRRACPRQCGTCSRTSPRLRRAGSNLPPSDCSTWPSFLSRARIRSVARVYGKLLLRGLDHVVQFEKRVVGYALSYDGTVVADLADGSTVRGDVLVGADGSASAIRKQLLPH